MDYKEKYEMALETIQEILDSGSDSIKMSRLRLRMQSVFPELKEDSKDEKIRKAIIEHFAESHSSMYPYKGFTKKQFLAWLEKQGKQEPINPELKESEDEEVRKEIVEYLKKNLRLEWATWLEKQGEVESDNDDIEVEEKGIREAFNKIEDEKQCKQKPQRMISAEAKEAMYNKPADIVEPKCEESKTKIFDAPTPFEDKLYVFVAACEFLAIPSKIEFILEHSQEILDAAREQIGKEQKSAEWSEEDEEYINDLIGVFDGQQYQAHSDEEIVKWLKSIRLPYNKEWDENDEEMLRSIIATCELAEQDRDSSPARHLLEMQLDWLNSLKTKVQPKQEWSEKDEEELEIAIDTLKESGRYDSAKWVQSLKQRIGG